MRGEGAAGGKRALAFCEYIWSANPKIWMSGKQTCLVNNVELGTTVRQLNLGSRPYLLISGGRKYKYKYRSNYNYYTDANTNTDTDIGALWRRTFSRGQWKGDWDSSSRPWSFFEAARFVSFWIFHRLFGFPAFALTLFISLRPWIFSKVRWKLPFFFLRRRWEWTWQQGHLVRNSDNSGYRWKGRDEDSKPIFVDKHWQLVNNTATI